MKETKPALATEDVALIRKVITYYLNNMFPVDKEEQEKLIIKKVLDICYKIVYNIVIECLYGFYYY
jgi:hypothetical protein